MSLPGFTQCNVDVGEVTLSVHEAGAGTPLILLHGYPENHHAWEKVAPALAERFRVIVPDLRGYGDSDAPRDDRHHAVYSKRAMAEDIVYLMDELGIETAHILGHDRGARVAYRFALDHPERITALGIVEIVPTSDMWAGWTADVALAAYHWTFLAQPAPLPERMIAADPGAYLETTLKNWSRPGEHIFSDAALQSYHAQMADPDRCAAMCADYRAGARFDRELDLADQAAGRKIDVPVHVLISKSGFPAKSGDPEGIWRRWAHNVSLQVAEGGHFLMEENPTAVLDAFLPFFEGITSNA